MPSGVLRNKLGITDHQLLAAADADITRARLVMLAERPLAEHEPRFMLTEKPTRAERSRRRSELLEAGPYGATCCARRVALASNGTPAVPATQSHPTNRRSAMTG
ncbi:hypothetical protein [Streptomyces europaeiscabiei]|uniref:hypothetical protein n=1 Tax=Streptomyces europaeiscabiei TaxID=146819 RepID=UPI0038F7D342